MPAFGFQFFHTFRTIESPTTVQFIVIVTFRHDAIPENFPGIVVVKGPDFVLQVSLDPLPAFRGDVLPPVFPAHLVQRYRDDSEKSGIPRAAERRGGYCNAAMVVEVDRQGDIFLQERFPKFPICPSKPCRYRSGHQTPSPGGSDDVPYKAYRDCHMLHAGFGRHHHNRC